MWRERGREGGREGGKEGEREGKKGMYTRWEESSGKCYTGLNPTSFLQRSPWKKET